MKVNKRNKFELVLQCAIFAFSFVPGFAYNFGYSFSLISWSYSASYFAFLFIAQFIFYTITCYKGNLLLSTLLLIFENIIFASQTYWIYSCVYNLGITFYIMLVLFIMLDIITILEYTNTRVTKGSTDYGEGSYDIVQYVLLCVLTLGIWHFVWIYKTTKYLNSDSSSEQYNPTNKLLLCIFIPFYQTYWFYKHGVKVDALCREKGIQSSFLTILCPLIPISFVSSVIMQDKINQICKSK